jgi:hypothetical protein
MALESQFMLMSILDSLAGWGVLIRVTAGRWVVELSSSRSASRRSIILTIKCKRCLHLAKHNVASSERLSTRTSPLTRAHCCFSSKVHTYPVAQPRPQQNTASSRDTKITIVLANPRLRTRMFGFRTPTLCPHARLPYSLKPAPNLVNLPFYTTHPNRLGRFKRPLIIAELLLTAGGILTPANEDAVFVS